MAKQFVAQFCFALGIVFTLFVILVPDEMFLQKPPAVQQMHTHQAHSNIPQNPVVNEDEAEREHLANLSGMSVADRDDAPPEDIADDVDSMDERIGDEDDVRWEDPVVSTEEEEEEEEVVQELDQSQRGDYTTEEISTDADPEVAESLDDFVHIEMQVHGGLIYNFDFSPSKVSLDNLASDFCYKHGADFGVTPDNMRPGCVDPVVAYLRSQVPQPTEVAPPKTSTKIALTIDNKEVVFSIDLSDPRSHEMGARSFCSQRGHEFGITAESMNECVEKVTQTLLQQIRRVSHEEVVAAAQV